MTAWDDVFAAYPAAGYLIKAAQLNLIVDKIKTKFDGTAGVDNTIPRAHGATGLVLQSSTVTLDDSGFFSGHRKYEYQHIPAESLIVDIPKSMEDGATGAETIKETLPNGFVREYRGYGCTSAQYSFAQVQLPDDYASGTIYARVTWETESEDLNTIQMEINAELVTDNDLTDLALSSASCTITDTNQGAGRLNKSTWTILNPSGSGNDLMMKLTRNYSTDTLDDDIKILWIDLKYVRLSP